MKRLLFFVLILLNIQFLSAQKTDNDEIYLQKLYKYTNSNNDSIFYYSNKLKKSENECNRYRALNFEAKALYQTDKCVESEEKCLTILKELNNTDVKCLKLNKLTALNRLFWIYKNKTDYNKAFEIAIRRKKLTETLGKKNAIYNASILGDYNNIAIIKDCMGFYTESRKILKESYAKLPEIYFNLSKTDYYKNPNQSEYFLKLNQSSTLNLIAESYLNSSADYTSKDLDSASIYFKKAYNVAKTFNPPHKNSETLYQIREVEVLIAKKKFKNALELIQKFNSNSKEFKTEQNINSLKAICFYNLNNTDSTLIYGKKYLLCYNENPKSKKRLHVIYDILANQYYKNNQKDSAYKYSELTIKELNFITDNKNATNKLHYLYDFNNTKELNETIKNTNKKNKYTFIFYSFVLLIIAIIIIYYFYKKNRKTKIELAKINIEVKDKPITPKKEYNINEELEETVLNGLIDLENSKDFLKPTFNINVLTKKLNTNTTYLSYIINKTKNKTFKNYITELRIEYLIKLLAENKDYRKYTIKYLAEEIGYTNASAFTRAFKKYKGVTPSEFIKTLK
ncbi:helix-turn-helix domain-containing protein [Polaribacter sp. Z022]|uniref:helix-turn-helix domain-containing protein n=1 Tax=Polaribacter sp. Z022 TaxID=2927125 RepID=UPI00202018C9|nr:helix-turn-helix domain-containing protein [Polaribacter sp. Z022]MCL7752875.1 helix-turn-helix domain-containing protein [Polaribacter sp. Z022]